MFTQWKTGVGGFITAVRTLTIIPLPGQEGAFHDSLPWFSLVGLLLGLVYYSLGSLWTGLLAPDWAAGGAALLILLDIIVTGALHLDGVADFADAMGRKGDKEARLATMKDPRVGAFGVIALVIVLLTKWLALERIFSHGPLSCIPFVPVISRDMAVELLTTLPYARPGEGMGRPFSRGATRSHRRWSHVLSLGICLLFGLPGIASFAMGWSIARVLRSLFKRVFNGVTGDLLGLSIVAIELTLFFLFALFAPFLTAP
ncbi:MAG: adenosylcobinamide-GDP ribazoletransferase [Deltaproteobacteria bacterium]|nr:adenosylcobinamide-GDP ribazoletransferase [Deltaproteobacteria bacterium]MBW2137951.1 adenosylcobinamide-GDP ribazoletransferase [Deltaproteobacteria bacterium]